MSKKDKATPEVTEEAAKVEVPKIEILRGRMLLPIVFCIKFLDTGTDAELAARYRTTGGKVSDIVNNRNFGYVSEATRFAGDDINAAVIFAEQLGEGEAVVKGLLSKLVHGNEADAEAIKTARAGARKTKPKAETAPEVATEEVEEEPQG